MKYKVSYWRQRTGRKPISAQYQQVAVNDAAHSAVGSCQVSGMSACSD